MDDQALFSHQSQWRPWAIGIVAKDKPFGTDEIALTSIERLPEQTGSINEEKREYSVTVESPLGGMNSQSLIGSGIMTATWAPMGQNHLLTSPMVRANEQVQIWKYADQDKLFWNTVFCEPGIRRIERVIMGAGNLSTPLEGLIGVENSYHIDFDTLSKKLSIRTTQSDGEAYAYSVILNPSENSVSIFDNIGNIFKIDSPNNNVSMTDASGAVFETRDGWPRIYGPKGVVIEDGGGNSAVLSPDSSSVTIKDSGGSVIDTKSGSPTITGSGAISMSTGSTINMSGSNVSMSDASSSFNNPVSFSDSVMIGGSLTVTGYANFPGGHTRD